MGGLARSEPAAGGQIFAGQQEPATPSGVEGSFAHEDIIKGTYVESAKHRCQDYQAVGSTFGKAQCVNLALSALWDVCPLTSTGEFAFGRNYFH